MKAQFTIKKRKDRKGRDCIAPFINDWNVWDIPEKQWTPEVQDAVARAFYIGARLMRDHIQQLHPTIPEFPVWEETQRESIAKANNMLVDDDLFDAFEAEREACGAREEQA